jgi:Barstar (barnase inhibitor)
VALFGRNASAFDDFLRDLDNMVNTATGRPPAPAYLTVINNAHLVLADQPEAFSWFAGCMPFYRDYYRAATKPVPQPLSACYCPHPRSTPRSSRTLAKRRHPRRNSDGLSTV